MFNFLFKKKIDKTIQKRQSEIEERILQLESELFAIRFVKILSNEKRIKQKIYKNLLQIVESECIKLIWIDDIVKMNDIVYGQGVKVRNNELARGIYSYKYNDEKKVFLSNKTDKPPKIFIALDENKEKIDYIWTLAHEIGHHFSIKLYNDETEKGANDMIRKILSLCLNEDEMFFIENDLKIYSDCLSFYFDKEKPVYRKVFYDLEAEFYKRHNYIKMLEKIVAEKYRKRKSNVQ